VEFRGACAEERAADHRVSVRSVRMESSRIVVDADWDHCNRAMLASETFGSLDLIHPLYVNFDSHLQLVSAQSRSAALRPEAEERFRVEHEACLQDAGGRFAAQNPNTTSGYFVCWNWSVLPNFTSEQSRGTIEIFAFRIHNAAASQIAPLGGGNGSLSREPTQTCVARSDSDAIVFVDNEQGIALIGCRQIGRGQATLDFALHRAETSRPILHNADFLGDWIYIEQFSLNREQRTARIQVKLRAAQALAINGIEVTLSNDDADEYLSRTVDLQYDDNWNVIAAR